MAGLSTRRENSAPTGIIVRVRVELSGSFKIRLLEGRGLVGSGAAGDAVYLRRAQTARMLVAFTSRGKSSYRSAKILTVKSNSNPSKKSPKNSEIHDVFARSSKADLEAITVSKSGFMKPFFIDSQRV